MFSFGRSTVLVSFLVYIAVYFARVDIRLFPVGQLTCVPAKKCFRMSLILLILFKATIHVGMSMGNMRCG